MKESEAKPSLRISHIVYGRQHENGRVKYLVDPCGAGEERAIPEEVVLRRWRRRRFTGFTFSGERLSSTIWRALPELFRSSPEEWVLLSLAELKEMREAGAARLRDKHYVLPAAETMTALFAVCGSAGLRALVDRHANPERIGHSGVPDLFLFARDKLSKPTISRFVEVKKPEEPVSRDQLDEIAFLQKLGLHARVLRLIERK
jgi:hypothetical protein